MRVGVGESERDKNRTQHMKRSGPDDIQGEVRGGERDEGAGVHTQRFLFVSQ